MRQNCLSLYTIQLCIIRASIVSSLYTIHIEKSLGEFCCWKTLSVWSDECELVFCLHKITPWHMTHSSITDTLAARLRLWQHARVTGCFEATSCFEITGCVRTSRKGKPRSLGVYKIDKQVQNKESASVFLGIWRA